MKVRACGGSPGALLTSAWSRTVKAYRRHLREMPLPAIVHWERNHWVVVYDVTDQQARIADPAIGLRKLPRSQFDESWTGYAVLLEPTEAFRETPEAEPARRWLWPVFRPHRNTVLTAALLALVVSALQMVLPVFVQIVVDRVLPDRDFGLLRLVALSMAALVLVMSAGSLAQRWLLSRAAVRVDGSSLDLPTARLLALPLRYFYARRTGDIQRRLIGMRQVREFAVQQGVVGLSAAAQLLAAVALMFVYSRVLTLVFVAFLPTYVLLMRG